VIGKVVAQIYRAVLDISFRRSGALFVILRNRNSLRDIVRVGDAIGDTGRSEADQQLDHIFQNRNIQTLPRSVLVELASLDGAVVIDNKGFILAYGAVLDPKKRGKLRGTEGSRTKAAIGASNYGISLKVSSDGDITIFHQGAGFIKV
jgi:DNA integrity scanning protein DisA with diadenylate cyclase activity